MEFAPENFENPDRQKVEEEFLNKMCCSFDLVSFKEKEDVINVLEEMIFGLVEADIPHILQKGVALATGIKVPIDEKCLSWDVCVEKNHEEYPGMRVQFLDGGHLGWRRAPQPTYLGGHWRFLMAIRLMKLVLWWSIESRCSQRATSQLKNASRVGGFLDGSGQRFDNFTRLCRLLQGLGPSSPYPRRY